MLLSGRVELEHGCDIEFIFFKEIIQTNNIIYIYRIIYNIDETKLTLG